MSALGGGTVIFTTVALRTLGRSRATRDWSACACRPLLLGSANGVKRH